jgi:hypothetical protein
LKEQIVNCLNDKKKGESNRILLAFCKEPRTPGEVQKISIKGDVLQILVGLKNAEAISFADGKYFATTLGLEVLSSM